MKFFSVDGKLFTGFNKILDIMYLNILWILFSLPIITIGASTTAAFQLAMKMVNDEEGYIGRGFVKAFKENFKQSTIVWIIMMVLGEILYINYQLIGNLKNPPIILYVVTVIATFLYVIVFIAVFPLIARYENTIKQTLINSYMITVRHLGHTVGMLLLLGIFGFFYIISNITLIFGSFIIPGLLIYIASSCYLKIFQKVEGAREATIQAKKELEEEKARNM
ncbi:MAG: DUF624 domain-containing protein [bacterium]|nr:DUF624 domain-containing protein [bacterium]